MHIPEGFWKNGLGDIEVIFHEGVLHAFYLCLGSHDGVGHLTSKDGLVWQEQACVLYPGGPGEFDGDQIWTMGVFQLRGRFFMLYTGLALQERGKIQRVGLAVSDDLYHWEKYAGNPVLEADPRYYEATADAENRIDWRDPFVFQENGLLHGVICARVNRGPFLRRGAAGYFTSRDGYQWDTHDALCHPGHCFDFETPALTKIHDRYYLTGIAGRNVEGQPVEPSIFRVSDAVTGPYRQVGHELLLPGDNQVFKPCQWRGQTYYFHHLRGTADWETGAGHPITALPPPKLADTDDQGGLVLRPFRDWAPVSIGELRKVNPGSQTTAGRVAAGRWTENEGVLYSSGVEGFEAFAIAAENSDFILEAAMKNPGRGSFGIFARSTFEAGEGTFVSLDSSIRRARLATLRVTRKTPSAGVTYAWRGRRIVQEWIDPSLWGEDLTLRVVLYGPYVEVSLNDRVLLSAICGSRAGSSLGFFAENAPLGLVAWSLQPLTPRGSALSSV
jgi:beta-fructofuranosidase